MPRFEWRIQQNVRRLHVVAPRPAAVGVASVLTPTAWPRECCCCGQPTQRAGFKNASAWDRWAVAGANRLSVVQFLEQPFAERQVIIVGIAIERPRGGFNSGDNSLQLR